MAINLFIVYGFLIGYGSMFMLWNDSNHPQANSIFITFNLLLLGGLIMIIALKVEEKKGSK